MENKEPLTEKKIFHLARKLSISSQIPIEIYHYFDLNFDFTHWKWDSKYNFWEFLNDFYPQNVSNKENIVCIEDKKKIKQLIKGISWIIKILQDEQATPKNQKIAFELTCCISCFWKISYDEGITFSESSKRLALSYLDNITIDLLSNSDASINEKEYIKKVYSTLKNCQWNEIETNHLQIRHIYDRISLKCHRSYLFIVEHHSSEIFNRINDETNVCKLLYWLHRLPEEHIQSLILETKNNQAKFLLLLDLQYLACNEPEKKQLQLWKVWQVSPIKWLQVFNKYPSRYPLLQLGLGKFLISATNEQIQLYIDSVKLSTPPETIQDCLKYFLENSAHDNIEYFCKLAYQKWKSWDFDDHQSIFRSCFDMVIVKYFHELSDEERNTFIQEEINHIFNFNKLWFINVMEANKFIYLHLSRLQPVYIANAKKQDDSLSYDELSKKTYYPPFFQDDLRWRNWFALNSSNLD